MSIVLGGQAYEVPGVRSISWRDDPRRVPRTRNVNPRTSPIRAIVLHSTHGTAPTRVVQGSRAPTNPYYFANDVVNNSRGVSWDATILTDGTVLWHSDPLEVFTWHANQVNPHTIGIELDQGPQDEVYSAQLDAEAALVDFLTAKLGIQRQIPWRGGDVLFTPLARLSNAGGAGRDVSGVYAHANVTSDRSDPNRFIFRVLKAKGYEGLDFGADEDLAVWRQRQADLGLTPDGIPGRATAEALRAAGYGDGMWTNKPFPWALLSLPVLGIGWWAWQLRKKR